MERDCSGFPNGKRKKGKGPIRVEAVGVLGQEKNRKMRRLVAKRAGKIY